MLASLMKLIAAGIGFLGIIVAGMGGVNLGMTVKDGMQGGGGQLAGALAMIAGGGIIIAAAVLFGTADVSWAK